MKGNKFRVSASARSEVDGGVSSSRVISPHPDSILHGRGSPLSRSPAGAPLGLSALPPPCHCLSRSPQPETPPSLLCLSLLGPVQGSLLLWRLLDRQQPPGSLGVKKLSSSLPSSDSWNPRARPWGSFWLSSFLKGRETEEREVLGSYRRGVARPGPCSAWPGPSPQALSTESLILFNFSAHVQFL